MLCVRLVAVVDRPTVGAAVDQPVVAAGNTAGTGDSGDLGAADTGADHPGLCIDAHQATHIFLTLHGAGDGDRFNQPLVPAGQQTDAAFGAAGGHPALQI